MSVENFILSIDFIVDQIFPMIGVGAEHHLTAEFLGGELLTVPHEEIAACDAYLHQKLAPIVRTLRTGAQSNLIASPDKVLKLYDTFKGNVGTSTDDYSSNRTVKGSSDLYRAMLNRSLKHLNAERSAKIGRVFVVDRDTVQHVPTEVARSIKDGYPLTLRPVFSGGSDDVAPAALPAIIDSMSAAFDLWKSHAEHPVEPFYSLYHRRAKIGRESADGPSGCPFQSDCAVKSLSLDPNGDLYICQEMADSKNHKLGNSVDRTFDTTVARMLRRRTAMLSDDCRVCTWKNECGGGCMNEAINYFGNPFAKTELCPVWKILFAKIDDHIAQGR